GVVRGGKAIGVKRLNQDARLSERQFMSEVTILQSTQHKNITKLEGYCYCLPDDTDDAVTERLLCYELPRGPDRRLDTVLFGGTCNSNKQGLDWGTRFEIIQGICQGVQYLHKECPDAPVVGLDLNPAIIWLDDGMVPKLGDFGHSQAFLEKAAPRTPTTNAFGPIMGYMAPEYINSGIITAESDIFNLGVLIVEIVTGEKCGGNRTDHYSGRSFVEKVQNTWTEDYPSILSKHPSLEERFIPKIRSFIKMGLRCVKERPEERPTIDQIIRFLRHWFPNTKDLTARQTVSVLLETTEPEPEPAARRYLSRRRLDYFHSTPEGRRMTTEPAERRKTTTTTKRSRGGDESDSDSEPAGRRRRRRNHDENWDSEREPAADRGTKRRRSELGSSPEPPAKRNGRKLHFGEKFSGEPPAAGRSDTKLDRINAIFDGYGSRGASINDIFDGRGDSIDKIFNGQSP
ncbi:hypothetical protein U9M48_004813, partial [Paspalum notatum var. saurae]